MSVVQRVIIESGLMYTLTAIILLIMGVLKSAAAFILADVVS
jgi:hypothetical protein